MNNTINVQVYTITTTQSKNYLTTIKMPNYKQHKRVINYLRNYVKEQSHFDYVNNRMRFYIFDSKDNFIIKETELSYD